MRTDIGVDNVSRLSFTTLSDTPTGCDAGLDGMVVYRMADPWTLGALGAVALTEGIKFLYGQAGEALKRWRERGADDKMLDEEEVAAEPVQAQLPAAFEGTLRETSLDMRAVAALEQELRDLRAALAEYVQGIDQVDPENTQLLEQVDALRRAMEAVYGQPIAFKGEPGPPSGADVAGHANVDEVLGYVAGLRAKKIVGRSVTGRVVAKKVDREGQAIGLDVDTIE